MNQFESYLNLDTITYLSQNNPSAAEPLSSTSQTMHSMIKEQYLDADRAIMNIFPLLIAEIDKINIKSMDPTRLFTRLVNNLHDEAKRLNCDQTCPLTLSPLERMNWEFIHYNALIKEILLHTQQAKTEDVNKFVTAVALEIGISIPPSKNPKNFWEETLKNDSRIKQIESLGLVGLKMKFLPPEIASLSNLKELYLGDNQLKEMPAEFFSLSGLLYLDLSENNLQKIPSELISFSMLKYLDLRNNQLTEISKDLVAMQNLKWLYLTGNQIKEIPSAMAAHPKLEWLHLGNNQIEEIPLGITLIPTLQELSLDRNPLTPSTLTSLTAIQKQLKQSLEITLE